MSKKLAYHQRLKEAYNIKPSKSTKYLPTANENLLKIEKIGKLQW